MLKDLNDLVKLQKKLSYIENGPNSVTLTANLLIFRLFSIGLA